MDKPFLAHLSVPRQPAPALPGYYSEDLHIQVVGDGANEVPFVKAHRNVPELLTKTKADREDDDVNAPLASLRMLLTKTAVSPEDDEQCNAVSALRMLLTKTEAEREDDE